MIEKRPYWQTPNFNANESKQIQESKVMRFAPLTDFPFAFAQWNYDAYPDVAPIFCSYFFSNGTSEQFLLSHQSQYPSGQKMLTLTITDQNDDKCSHFFTLQKVKLNYFVITYYYSVPEFRYYSESEFENNLEIEQDWDDWESSAAAKSQVATERNQKLAREDLINNSPYKDLYLKAVLIRDKMVSELMFDQTFTEIFDQITNQLPCYIKYTSYIPSLKTGKNEKRYFFLDNPTDRELKGYSLYFDSKIHLNKKDVIIFQASLSNEKNLHFRNQPIARIKSNGEITWKSFQDELNFSLGVRDILQEIIGHKFNVINREMSSAVMVNNPFFSHDVALELRKNQGAIIYDKHINDGGDVLIIKAEPAVLAFNFVNMLRISFGLTHQGVQLDKFPDLSGYHSDQDLQFELFEDVESLFTKTFYEALSGNSE